MISALDAVRRRRSYSHVTAEAPTHEQLVPLVEAAARVADHGNLAPWRLIEIRGTAREKIGRAFAKTGSSADKPLRASLLIAVVAVHRPSSKAPEWEQDAVASGVAHVLSLLLDEAGWGVIWRTGDPTRKKKVAKAHKLTKNEKLMGWLYVGGIPEKTKPGKKDRLNLEKHLTSL
ncbi:MAG: nitroreductase [Micrococcales bacterium 70-64]|nr:MAG: nitroreductase [Leifsonia sp. SCN 70-46]OJX87213.1 MAG: nitroreductase [Micrococcales bacterium 70-64]